MLPLPQGFVSLSLSLSLSAEPKQNTKVPTNKQRRRRRHSKKKKKTEGRKEKNTGHGALSGPFRTRHIDPGAYIASAGRQSELDWAAGKRERS